MRNLVHIDCTLRDGGYYNNWDFSEDLINQYLKVMKFLNIDFVNLDIDFQKIMDLKDLALLHQRIF